MTFFSSQVPSQKPNPSQSQYLSLRTSHFQLQPVAENLWKCAYHAAGHDAGDPTGAKDNGPGGFKMEDRLDQGGTSTYLHPNPLICPHPLPYPYPHIPSATRMHCFGWSEAQAAPVAQRAAPAVLHLPGEVAEPTVSPAPAEPWIAVQPIDLRWFEVFLPINGQLELVHIGTLDTWYSFGFRA